MITYELQKKASIYALVKCCMYARKSDFREVSRSVSSTVPVPVDGVRVKRKESVKSENKGIFQDNRDVET